MEKKLQKTYFTHYNLLKVQDLWQSHYQIFPSGMRRRSNVPFRSHIGRGVTDHAETSS